MSIRISLIFVFAVFALIVFPVAIASHSHLYADGVHFIAKILESRTCDTAGYTPSRVGHHLLTQGVVVVMLDCGVRDIGFLSKLYGIALFYLPWLAYALTAHRFLSAGMPYHAILVTLMYCILMCLTSMFIISETHLAAALFVLTIAMLTTCDQYKWSNCTVLFVLWLLSVSIYEFWAVYFLACLALLLFRSGPKHRTHAEFVIRSVFAVLYLVGACANIKSIIFTPVPINRDAMFDTHFDAVWRLHIATSIMFMLAILYVAAILIHEHRNHQQLSRLVSCVTPIRRFVDSTAFLVVFGLLTASIEAAVILYDLVKPADSYPLRSLNLVLPLLFALFLGLFKRPAHLAQHIDPFASQRALVFGLVATLLMSSQTILMHARGFTNFRKAVFEETQSHFGYVALETVLPGEQKYGWFWTYPTMSVILQAMQLTPIRSIIYNPGVSWQPLSPRDLKHVRKLVATLELPVEMTELLTNGEQTVAPVPTSGD